MQPHELGPTRILGPWDFPGKSGLPLPSPGNLPDPGIKPGCPSLKADALPSEPPGKSQLRVSTSGFFSPNAECKATPSPPLSSSELTGVCHEDQTLAPGPPKQCLGHGSVALQLCKLSAVPSSFHPLILHNYISVPPGIFSNPNTVTHQLTRKLWE